MGISYIRSLPPGTVSPLKKKRGTQRGREGWRKGERESEVGRKRGMEEGRVGEKEMRKDGKREEGRKENEKQLKGRGLVSDRKMQISLCV